MAKFEKGDRVIATDRVMTGVFASVDKGTKGVVADIDDPIFGSTTYEIHWEDGERSTSAEEDSLAKLASESAVDGSSCLMLLTGTVFAGMLMRAVFTACSA